MNINIGEIKSVILPARPIVTPTPPTPSGNVYGVEWDGSSSTLLTRTDDATNFANPNPYVAGATNYGSPFDDVMPWTGIERVTNENAGELVKIPKFWFKLEISDEHPFKLQISDHKEEGFSVAPAFMDRGDGKGERDFVYVGRYHCSETNYKSVSGVKPKVNITRAEARAAISALNRDVWQWDYAMLITIQMLYIVEFANWDSQAVIGLGCSETSVDSSSVFNCGGTDLMPYHTGTVSASRSEGGNCQYRYIENLWGNCKEWVDGIYSISAVLYINNLPETFSDSEGGIKAGYKATNVQNYISTFYKSSRFFPDSGLEWFYYPYDYTYDKRYVSDVGVCGNYSGVVLNVGGSYQKSNQFGLFFVDFSSAATYKSDAVGSRLMVLP